MQPTSDPNSLALDSAPESTAVGVALSTEVVGTETLAANGVEFALVLARMIQSVRTDPEQLRSAIYDLARHKLDEQLGTQPPEDARTVKSSLEIAIRGVEQFFRDNEERDADQQQLGNRLPAVSDELQIPSKNAPELPEPHSVKPASNGNWQGRIRKPSVAAGLLLVLVLAGIFVWRIWPDFWLQKKSIEPQPASPSLAVAPRENIESAHRVFSDPLVPLTYGVYAISDTKLVEIRPLSIRAPDVRVAMSAAIESTSQALLPDGKIRFVVYRREQTSNIAERAEVRIVAKVARTTSYETGQPKVTEDQKWVIRNISFPYRIAPLKDHPEMDEITSDLPNAELTPGRYALVLNKQAYDFTVQGPLSDPRQCLERIAAANGTFYSQCDLASMIRR